jgi:hypothetical protein
MTADAFINLNCPRWSEVWGWMRNDDPMDTMRRPEYAPAVSVPGIIIRKPENEPELTAAHRIDRAIQEMLERANRTGRAATRRRRFKQCKQGSFDPELVRAMFEESQRKAEKKRAEQERREAEERERRRVSHEAEVRAALEKIEQRELRRRRAAETLEKRELRERLICVLENNGNGEIYLAETERLGDRIIIAGSLSSAEMVLKAGVEKYGAARAVRRIEFDEWVDLVWQKRNPTI